VASGIAALIYAAAAADAYWIEPDWPAVRRIQLEAAVSEPLCILHLSDLHIEKAARARERWLVTKLGQLCPDLILLTGDIHQLDNTDSSSLGQVLEPMKAPLGVFACTGYDNVAAVQNANPAIRFLCNDSVILTRGPDVIGLGGLLPISGRERVYEAIARATCRIIMNHTPDLADEAARHFVDLYCCGHTHGGQVRIPLWGAITTNSATGKRYEAGLHRNGRTWIYTSRGLGLEPPPAPQARFLCRPEITLITLVPQSHAG
jgi:hypothetical protein